VVENETALFTVILSDETTDVKWYKDSEEIVSDQRIKFVKDDKVRQLVIKSVNVHDEGEYTCVLVGDDEECSADLNIVGKMH